MYVYVCVWQQHNRLSSVDENSARDSASLLQDLLHTNSDDFVCGGEMLVNHLILHTDTSLI